MDDVGNIADKIGLPNPVDIVNGAINGVNDAKALVGDVVEGDFHGALTNGRKLIGDAQDVIGGLGSLGVFPNPTGAALDAVLKLADSRVLAAAQMTIAGMKATTGNGQPDDGGGFRGSAQRLATAVETLIDAEPHADRWDGTASQVYNAVNASHRRLTSDTQAADSGIAAVIQTEAEQILRTRQHLDDISQFLYDYGLATAVANYSGPGKAAQLIADMTVAAGAIQTANVTMAILTKNVIENAARVKQHIGTYEKAQDDTSGEVNACDPFAIPTNELPRPDDSTKLPTPKADGTVDQPKRTLPETPFIMPEPEEPFEYGPPATPQPAPLPPVPAAPNSGNLDAPRTVLAG
ncbi:EspA/EspE family type VII secretion system effector [Mycolicibacterium goodii]|uniref:EspA/EspE family type VII secretion system effector n=1 Tax=Mycolicibacterium goodii TaxID=134601 RepID=UPI00257E6042|nr:EspA/EspE family type VII secretion system effector [Mycolicibacterium goodii]